MVIQLPLQMATTNDLGQENKFYKLPKGVVCLMVIPSNSPTPPLTRKKQYASVWVVDGIPVDSVRLRVNAQRVY